MHPRLGRPSARSSRSPGGTTRSSAWNSLHRVARHHLVRAARDRDGCHPDVLERPRRRRRRSFWDVIVGARTPPDGFPLWAMLEVESVTADLGARVADRRGVEVCLTPDGTLSDHTIPSRFLLVAHEPGALFRNARSGVLQLREFVVVDVITLREIDLTDVDLRAAALDDVDLSGATMAGADLHGASLCDADLAGADLREACLREAGLCGSDLTNVDATDADLTGADLSSTTLVTAILSGATLVGANLDQADLNGADLQGADLRDADLCSDFRMASVEGADFLGTAPWSSIWEFASADSSTRWPEGFAPEDEDMTLNE